MNGDRLFKETFRLAWVGVSKCLPLGLKLQRSQHFQKSEEGIYFLDMFVTSHAEVCGYKIVIP